MMSKKISFSQLKPGSNHYLEKFDTCPDKNANVAYMIWYQKDQNYNSKQNRIEAVPLSQSQYTTWQKENYFQGRQNAYMENNLLSTKRLNNFIQKLEKKPVGRFSVQVGKNLKQKNVQSQFLSKNSQFFSKSSSKDVKGPKDYTQKDEKKSLFSDKKELSVKDKDKNKNCSEELQQQLKIERVKTKQLTEELKRKTLQIFQEEQKTASLNLKYKTLENEYKKIVQQNSALKSTIQRLEDKINAHRQKYEGMTLSYENNTMRYNTKQSQYREQIKNLTQKTTTADYQKQKLLFEIQTLKCQNQKNLLKLQEQLNKTNLKHEQQSNEMTKKLIQCEQTIQKLAKQKACIEDEVQNLHEKSFLTLQELTLKTQRQESLSDEIIQLKLQVQKANAKLLFYSHTQTEQKKVTELYLSLKTELLQKESVIGQIQRQMNLLRSTAQKTNCMLEKEKQASQTIMKSLNESKTQNLNLNKKVQRLTNETAQLETKIKTKQNQVAILESKVQELLTKTQKQELLFRDSAFKNQNDMKLKNLQISDLQSKNNQFKAQISKKSSQLNQANKIIRDYQEIIDQVTIVTEKYQMKFLNNDKINKVIEDTKIYNSQSSKNPSKLVLNSQISHNQSNKDEDKQNKNLHSLPFNIRKFNSTMIFRLEQFSGIIQDINEQKNTLQRQMGVLSDSLERLHSETLEEKNWLRGTKTSLEDKLTTNQKIMTKMKLIIEDKTKQIASINQKLNEIIIKNKELKQTHQIQTEQLRQCKQTIEQKQTKIRKLVEQSKSKELVKDEVQRKLRTRLKDLQNEFQQTKLKQVQHNKIKTLGFEQIKRNYFQATQKIEELQLQIVNLKQALAVNKLQIQRVNTLFVQIYKQINNIEKQGTTAAFLFIPLREAVKKVQAQVNPKPTISLPSTSSKGKQEKLTSAKSDKEKLPPSKNEKQKVNIRTTNARFNQLPPSLLKSPESKISINSLNSVQKKALGEKKSTIQKRQRIRSKESQKL